MPLIQLFKILMVGKLYLEVTYGMYRNEPSLFLDTLKMLSNTYNCIYKAYSYRKSCFKNKQRNFFRPKKKHPVYRYTN